MRMADSVYYVQTIKGFIYHVKNEAYRAKRKKKAACSFF